MAFEVRIAPRAQRHIDEFATYLKRYDAEIAVEQIERLDRILSTNLANLRLPGLIFP